MRKFHSDRMVVFDDEDSDVSMCVYFVHDLNLDLVTSKLSGKPLTKCMRAQSPYTG